MIKLKKIELPITRQDKRIREDKTYIAKLEIEARAFWNSGRFIQPTCWMFKYNSNELFPSQEDSVVKIKELYEIVESPSKPAAPESELEKKF